MDMFLGGAAAGLIVGGLAVWLLLIMSGGGKKSFDLGMKVAKKAAGDPEFAAKIDRLFVPPPPPKPSGEALRLLAVLQREARLLDFLMENIQAYADDQVGASVRDIHAKAQTALKKHLVLEPVLSGQEGSTATIAAGFDPSAIRLVGNVTGQPPFRGTLTHAGWRAKSFDLPRPPEGQDEFVLMPAEVELA